MEIILAKTAGYCFGVNGALDAVEKAIEDGQVHHIHTLGPIIHNPQVIEKLEARGVKTVERLDEIRKGTVVIRSHGVGEDIIKEAEEKKLNLINATCPYVKSIQKRVKKYYNEDYQIIIIGNKDHPEVKGINGWCNDSGIIVDNKNNVPNLAKYDKICVVAQTTITNELFTEITEKIKEEHKNVAIFNTICSATKERQEETERIAKYVDCMIIIGGYNSSNTQKLASISKKYCNNTFHIETKKDLNMDNIKKYEKVGISAGASTPQWIIEEVINFMENQEHSMESMNSTYEDTFKSFRKGGIVEGKVISASKDEIIVNIGYKTDGIIKKSEYTKDLNVDLSTIVNPQDNIEALVLNIGTDAVELSVLRLEERKAKDELEKAYEEGKVFEGKVIKAIKGGLMVDIGISEVFMPASQYHYKFVKDLESLVGKQVRAKIIEFDKKKNKVILSQKVIVEAEHKAKVEADTKVKGDFFSSLEVGQKISGKVKSIMNYGVFVNIGALDGFVHISDLSHSKVNHPNDVLSEGDTIEAVIINLDEENQKIKLSVKEMTEDPWTSFTNNNNKGDIVEGTITNTVSFGAFAEIAPTVEGLIHISEISHEKVESVDAVLHKGDTVKVKIIGIDNDKKKVSLSIKETIERREKHVEIEENVSVYKDENANPTLGDLFGDLFK